MYSHLDCGQRANSTGDPRRTLVPLIQLRVHVVLHTTVATCTALVPYTVTL